MTHGDPHPMTVTDRLCEWTNPDPDAEFSGCNLPAADPPVMHLDHHRNPKHVCPHHHAELVAAGWVSHLGTRPDGDDSDYRGDVRNAIETALAATPKGGAARTLEAKAEHVHEHLERAGWVLTHPEPDETPVMLVPGQQVVEVPDGHTVEVVPTTPTYSYADNELDTLAGIVTQLENLDPESRERVAAFVTHRYGPAAPASSPWAAALAGWDPSRPARLRAEGGVIPRGQAVRISESDGPIVRPEDRRG